MSQAGARRSDPKGPTPLTAEELAWLSNSETFRDPDARWDTAWLRSALATIDAQATEIAALRAVSEQQQQRAQLAEGKLEGYRQALESIRDNRNAQPGVPCSGSCVDKAERVLAGK